MPSCRTRPPFSPCNQPETIHTPSSWMETAMSNVTALREKAGESEKITINLGYVDLGRVDLLV